MKKNEKLNLMVNKIVDYNKPNTVHYNGFLFKDHNGYYIKVVEIIDNEKKTLYLENKNNNIYLQDGDEQYITTTDKPKLMRVSLKSWHYRLIKFILRSNAPTPQTMQNGCPYFWLLLFSILVTPFVLLWKVFVFFLLLIPKTFMWFVEVNTNKWINDVDDIAAYNIYWHGWNSHKYMPIIPKIFFNKTDKDFFNYYLQKKHKNWDKLSNKKREEKLDNMKKDYYAWCEKESINRQKRLEEKRSKDEKQRRKREEYNEKHEARRLANQAKWDARMKPIHAKFKSIFASISRTFAFKCDWNNLIKITKRVVGGIITLIFLVATYFAVNGIAFVLTTFIDWSIANWEVYVGIVIGAVLVGIVYFLYVLITNWIQSVINKYRRGKRIWYIETLIYGIYYPLKYIALFLGYCFIYVIWIPIKYIFYKFLWKIILVNIGILLWKFLRALGRGLAKSMGVFGEYLGASYSDYCPGIEWVDTEEEKCNENDPVDVR